MCAEREMGSRDKDQATPHQPLLSSLVIRPTDNGGGGAGSDYEPGEVRRDPPPYSRSDRYDGHAVNIAWCKNLILRKACWNWAGSCFWFLSRFSSWDNSMIGYRLRAGSVSPVRRRDAHHRFSPGFEHSDGGLRGRGFGNGRDPGRYRDYSPTYGRGKDGGRFAGRGYDRSVPGPGAPRGEGLRRNNPNVQPREGDWICSDPSCKNLNFARREYCNSCNRPRFGSSGSPRRGYPGPLPFPPRQRVPPAPLDHSPGRIMSDGYRSPHRSYAPRDFRPPGPLARHEGRFLDPLMRNDRRGFPEDEPRDRFKYDRPMVPDWDHRDRGRDNFFNERRGYGRRALSPPPAPAIPPRAWAPHIRERSRSPVRGAPPPKDYPREMYTNRRRDDRRGGGRDAF